MIHYWWHEMNLPIWNCVVLLSQICSGHSVWAANSVEDHIFSYNHVNKQLVALIHWACRYVDLPIELFSYLINRTKWAKMKTISIHDRFIVTVHLLWLMKKIRPSRCTRSSQPGGNGPKSSIIRCFKSNGICLPWWWWWWW